ncbi:NOC4L protein, partial [Atlantisia rogersi]|nr:NOC4L protein [Atlantisia rogersi]
MARAAELASCLEAVLANRGNANRVLEILEPLAGQEEEEDILCAVRTCSRLFGALLERGELFVGRLPAEEASLADNYSAGDKYKMWMRHRYNDCVGYLAELMGHDAFQVKEMSLSTLMKFVELEAQHPLIKVEWKGTLTFPRELLKVVVDGLLPLHEDASLLISRFQEYMEYDDVRYFVIKAVTESIGQVMQKTKERPPPFYQQNVFSLISPINMPNKESDMVRFMAKQVCLTHCLQFYFQAHKQAFEKMWLSFLKHKLPTGLYKKVLVILHDSVLPYMNEPTLMIDFLTVAYGIGGAISLLALNGLFILIHQHNL